MMSASRVSQDLKALLEILAKQKKLKYIHLERFTDSLISIFFLHLKNCHFSQEEMKILLSTLGIKTLRETSSTENVIEKTKQVVRLFVANVKKIEAYKQKLDCYASEFHTHNTLFNRIMGKSLEIILLKRGQSHIATLSNKISNCKILDDLNEVNQLVDAFEITKIIQGLDAFYKNKQQNKNTAASKNEIEKEKEAAPPIVTVPVREVNPINFSDDYLCALEWEFLKNISDVPHINGLFNLHNKFQENNVLASSKYGCDVKRRIYEKALEFLHADIELGTLGGVYIYNKIFLINENNFLQPQVDNQFLQNDYARKYINVLFAAKINMAPGNDCHYFEKLVNELVTYKKYFSDNKYSSIFKKSHKDWDELLTCLQGRVFALLEIGVDLTNQSPSLERIFNTCYYDQSPTVFAEKYRNLCQERNTI